jgi:hypothetical protein
MGGTGLEPSTDFPKEMQNPKRSAAKCAAIPTDLTKVVAAWPSLPEASRRAILALVDSAH